MFSQTARNELLETILASQAVDQGRRWVLAAMQRHGQELVTLLWRILGNDQDVCDAYQSTFLRLAHMEDATRPAKVKAYLFRTATNTALSMLRSRTAEQRKIPAVSTSDRIAQSPDHEIDQQQLVETLRLHISRLPAHLRDVVVLRDLAEMPYEGIAALMGITPGSARVYRCKAIELLAVWMDANGQEIYP